MKKLMSLALACVVGTAMTENDVIGSPSGPTAQPLAPPMTEPSVLIVGQVVNPNGAHTDDALSALADALRRQLELLDWEIDITSQYIAGLYNDLQHARETFASLVARMKTRSTSQLDAKSISEEMVSLARQMVALQQLIAEQENRLTRLLAEHDRIEQELAQMDTGGQTPLGIPIGG